MEIEKKSANDDVEKWKFESRLRLEQQAKSGANWFYWLAGLSVINTIMVMGNFGWVFIFGLGVTQIVDQFAVYISGNVATSIALAIDFVIVVIFVLLGYFSGKGHAWIFTLGMILYAIDGAILLLFEDFMSALFHVLVLYWMYNGLRAQMELNKHNGKK